MSDVSHVIQTCGACPSQWNVKLPDGRWLYVRYRYGRFSVTDWIVLDEEMGEERYSNQVGDGLDGCMDEDVMMYWLEKALAAG